MNIAVIGAGISGLGCAYQLAKKGHRVHIFEARDRIGGHTATYDVHLGARRFAIDTGFIGRNAETLLTPKLKPSPQVLALAALGVLTLEEEAARALVTDHRAQQAHGEVSLADAGGTVEDNSLLGRRERLDEALGLP